MNGPGKHQLLGFHSVSSALGRTPGQVHELIIARESKNARLKPLIERASQLGIKLSQRSRAELDQLADGERHQDVIAIFSPANLFGERDITQLLQKAGTPPLVLVLDSVQDPHNLGACLRTADAAGVDFVVIARDKSAPLSATARRAASGAAEVIPIVIVTNLARALKQLKQLGLWLAGTSDAAKQGLFETDLSGPLALVMGGEGPGMRRLTQEHCDYLVSIPMRGSVESLNVSVATAVCLFEVVRQNPRAES